MFRFSCPFRGCGHVPEVREEKLGELLEGLAELGQVDTPGRVILNVGALPRSLLPLGSRTSSVRRLRALQVPGLL